MVLLFVGAQGATLRPGNLRYRVRRVSKRGSSKPSPM